MIEGMIPPQKPLLESQVLMSMIDDENVCNDGLIGLKEEHFYATRAKELFKVLKIADDRGGVDRVSVDALIADSDLRIYFDSILDVATTCSIRPLIATLKNFYEKRQILLNLDATERLCYDERSFSTAIIAELDVKNAIVTEESLDMKVYTLQESISITIDAMEARRGKVNGVPTGFKSFDEMYGGFINGEVITIAGSPGSGKTSMIIECVKSCIKRGFKPLVFSLEMPLTAIMERLLSNESSVDKMFFRKGDIPPDREEAVMDATNRLFDKIGFFNESGNLTIHQIRQISRKMRKLHEIDAVFIDYLQIIAKMGVGTMKEEIDEIMRVIRMLAKELKIPIILLSQLNRTYAKEKKPAMHMLKESGKIEEDSNMVLLLYNLRKTGLEEEAIERVNMIVDKCREGVMSERPFWFEGQYARFTEYMESEEHDETLDWIQD